MNLLIGSVVFSVKYFHLRRFAKAINEDIVNMLPNFRTLKFISD